ncbi:hypothetical protein L1987_25448 [Smallanthus sonchifolius]|uniref:Uncharacterized protein n=1 Tax=Smallanthus sonchifolius TaxID=185202 RepID=A0ACB9IQX9_9ASTR|nr:hypothetical protein L1987_25448 [Smallanthus sonchifolius]
MMHDLFMVQQGEIMSFSGELRKEKSRSDAQKLIVDVTSLLSSHMSRQKEMVGAHLACIRETLVGSNTVLNGHVGGWRE